ncbi:class I SAM-dependent methyltransferase [Streptomyces atriruber]|uniref:class I SAM-dependent methyltransferase n=1 Tax=Streptomyces atriruber TaxID=545121 RepID=UPI001FC9F09A|nr:class I SAM-dependent methyltransferase [Streptomyces atriruber]
MPTIPESEPHRHRRMAESFGVDAERYDRSRPRYPEALVARVVAAAPGAAVLDVGCGTGIVARQFLAAGCSVLGVEPDGRMADRARRLGVTAEVATFEEWDPAGREFDAVVAGQAWHWVDPAAGAAKAARVLRPGGCLVAFWNVHEPPPAIAEAFADAYERVAPDSPVSVRGTPERARDGHGPLLAKAADGIRAAGAFAAPEEWRFGWETTYTRDAWLDQLPTQGVLTRLAPDAVAEVLEAVGTAVDALGGSFTMRYVTVAVAAERAGRPGEMRNGVV